MADAGEMDRRAEFQQEIALEVAADPCLLCVVRGMVRSYVTDAGFDGDKTGEIVLGVDEACTNAIRHAYCGDRDRTYRVVLQKSECWLEIQVQEDGDRADTELYRDMTDTVPTDPEVIAPGGLGIQLIRKVFDEVTYCPETDQGNCVIMRLRRPESADGASLQGGLNGT